MVKLRCEVKRWEKNQASDSELTSAVGRKCIIIVIRVCLDLRILAATEQPNLDILMYSTYISRQMDHLAPLAVELHLSLHRVPT